MTDSDDDLEIYDYNQSRHDERKQNGLHRKPTLQANETKVLADDALASSPVEVDANGHDGGDDVSTDPDGIDEDIDSDDVEDDDEDQDEDNAPRHPYYTYGTEKADVHVDSKLIFQRHRMDTKSGSESGGSPFLSGKSLTMPLETHFESLGLGSSPTTAARRGQQVTNIKTSFPSSASMQSTEPFPALTDQSAGKKPVLDTLAKSADIKARDHSHHPNLPHEFKDPLLAEQGVHGAGAGVGLGDGPGGFAKNDGAIISEVEAICDKIKHILDLRQAYMTVSLQCPGDNPKDYDEWNIYPAPPEPVWDEGKNRPLPQKRDETTSHSAASSFYISDPKATVKDGLKWGSTTSMGGLGSEAPTSPTTARRKRKAGTHIGEDFEFSECHIPGKSEDGLTFKMDEGSIYQVCDTDDKPIVNVPTLRDYYMALDQILEIASDGPAKSFAYRRLQYLEGRYNLYTLLNEYEEVADTKKVPHRDFYNVRKVDTHVHHSACMNQKHLLRFIKSKMKKSPNDIVISRDGKQLTLREVFESINLTAYDLSIDTLDMHAHTDSFHRFDKFNLKYNPIGQSRLRDIFLKTDNFIKGRYLAEITREVIADLESSKYQMVEWRISIYGRSLSEWDQLATWVVDNKLFSPNVRWLIQVPRLFALYKQVNNMNNFEELLCNIFQPLFEVTMDPSTHPKLHIFLQRVIGFDCVDDESKPERRFYRKFPNPRNWNTKQNPPYGYWIYYLFANMTSLNSWRKRRGFNTFLLRPHCGEAGDTDHLAAAILCCHSISHGITLRKVPLLQYIFYLDQIGVAMSPLSNNALFLTYDRNPFISYFRKGLNVSLSTDDPLQFAFTKEPLIEEYSVAAQIYKLSAIEMCELAKHSVDQCGFELQLKRRWLGKYCYLPGVLGNDVKKGNVPNIREAFRHETLKGEHKFIAKYTENYPHLARCTPAMPEPYDPSTPAPDMARAFDSPRQWYDKVADTIHSATPDAHTKIHDFALLSKQSSPRHDRRGSKSSILSKETSHTDQQSQQQQLHHDILTRTSDRHLSAAEAKAFPGLMLMHTNTTTRERRAGSWRQSMSGSMNEGSVSSDRTSATNNARLEPAMGKFKSNESEEMKVVEESE